MANMHMAHCAKCGTYDRKSSMVGIYSSRFSCPKILCYMCEDCYAAFLDEHELTDRSDPGMYVSIHTQGRIT